MVLLRRVPGAPAGVDVVERDAYCGNATGVDNHSSFGYSLSSCAAAVMHNPRCAGSAGYFYYSQSYNGQCTCSRDGCVKRVSNPPGTYSIYKLDSTAPATGVDVTIDFAAIRLGLELSTGRQRATDKYDVYDIWAAGKKVAEAVSNYTAKAVPIHGTAFLRLEPSQ